MLFIRDHFDKLLLAILFLTLAFIVIHITHHENVDKEVVQAFTSSLSTILGGLITLVTGQLIKGKIIEHEEKKLEAKKD